MFYRKAAIATAVALVTALAAATPASARGGWHHHGGGWRGAGIGFAAGALIGGALASRPYGYGGGYGGYGGPYYGSYAYGGGPVVVDEGYAAPDRSDQYCSQRYKSYDPASGTYLGYDGDRHPCP